MCKRLICVTSRALCADDFIKRVRDILGAGVPVILREKDLSEDEYYRLLIDIGSRDIIAHTHADAARRAGCKKIHMPLGVLESAELSDFSLVGASAHSVREAARAERLGADYITAGHIFETDCKKGLAPRGTGLLSEIAAAVDMPVYALGGISPKNAGECLAAGAAGVCLMSGFMRCPDPKRYISSFGLDF